MPSQQKTRQSVVVIGAGIVGACVAWALQRDGWAVTLIDRQEPGTACSFGNAGLLHAGGFIPLATPGVLKRFPAMLLDPKSPLRLAWPYLPALMPWLFRLAAQARPRQLKHNIEALYALLKPARQAYDVVLHDTGLAQWVQTGGELYLYRSDQAMRAANWEMALRREKGIEVYDLRADDIFQLEPEVNPKFAFGHYLPQSDIVRSPYQLTKGLVAHVAKHGGQVVQAPVRRIESYVNGVNVYLPEQTIQASRAVVCAGAWSAQLLRLLSVAVPLESLRGYHIMLPHQNLPLGRVVVDADHHVAISPMTEGLRVIGFVELAGLSAPPNPSRSAFLQRFAQGIFPSLNTHIKSTWMGHRPGLPDSLPAIGAVPGHPSIFCAFGHGQLGLTLSAITGQLVADLMAQRKTSVDLAPFGVGRF